MATEIFKDRSKGGNGAFVIRTDAESVATFLDEMALALDSTLNELEGDQEFTIRGCLPLICSLYARLNGYKDETVYELRQLTVGAPFTTARERVGGWPPIKDVPLES